MDLNEYQKQLAEQVTFPGAGHSPIYPSLALTGAIGSLERRMDGMIASDGIERRVMQLAAYAGIAAEVVKVSVRDNQPIDRVKLLEALKNMFSFCFALSNDLDLKVNEIRDVMINKHPSISRSEPLKDDLKKDIKNCLIYLVVLCNELKLNLEEIINED